MGWIAFCCVTTFPNLSNAQCKWIDQAWDEWRTQAGRDSTAQGKSELDLILENVQKLRQQPRSTKTEADKSRPHWRSVSHVEQERSRRINALPISESRKETLRAGRIWIGATEGQACLAWGKPSGVNRTTTQTKVYEQWVYGSGRSYLYFENGILTTIQN